MNANICILSRWLPKTKEYACQKKLFIFSNSKKVVFISCVQSQHYVFGVYSVLYREHWAILNPNFSECRWYSPICRSSQDAEYSINDFVQCTVNILVMKNTLFSLIIKKIP